MSRHKLTSNNSKMIQERAILTMADKVHMIYWTAPF